MKIKKYLFTISFLFFQLYAVHAQEEKLYEDGTFIFGDSIETYVFNDFSRVRVSPQIDSEIIDTLPIGTSILLLHKSENILQLNGKVAAWYKIAYNLSGIKKEGYMWAGNFCLKPLRRGDVKFLYGINNAGYSMRNKDSVFSYIMMVKAIKTNQLIAVDTFIIDGNESANYADASINDKHGLAGVQYLVNVEIGGAACGIPSYQQVFAWTGTNFLKLPQLMSVGDADIYSYEEHFIFPADKKGKPNHIITIATQWEKDEKGKEHTSKKRYEYLWTSTGYQKLKQ